MAQTKILLDSNSYFRLAQNLHPLLCQPFGSADFTLYIHADLNAEFSKRQLIDPVVRPEGCR